MSKGTKKDKASKPSDEPKPEITSVKLPPQKTVEHPNKIIYSSGEEYKKSIDDLAKAVTAHGRENGKLVPFMIEGIENKVFLINCSNLYIVGYKNTKENTLKIFKNEDFTYDTSVTEYKFKDIKEESLNKKDLHTLGYMVAEAIRSTFIKEYISKHLYNIDIRKNILDHEIDYNRTDKGYDICRKMLEKLIITEIVHSFSKSNKDQDQNKNPIKELQEDLKALAIPKNEKTELIQKLEALDPEKLYGFKYLLGTQCPEAGEYKFDKHIDGYTTGLEYDIYIWDHS